MPAIILAGTVLFRAVDNVVPTNIVFMRTQERLMDFKIKIKKKTQVVKELTM